MKPYLLLLVRIIAVPVVMVIAIIMFLAICLLDYLWDILEEFKTGKAKGQGTVRTDYFLLDGISFRLFSRLRPKDADPESDRQKS